MARKKQTFDLKTLNSVTKALAETKDLKEIKAIRDKAEAARTYAQRAALSQQIQNQAAELKLQAERRAGDLLDDLAPHGGSRRARHHDGDLKLSELGINSNQSSRWRREAAVPEAVFQQYIAKANELGKDISSQGLLRIARSLTVQQSAESRPRSRVKARSISSEATRGHPESDLLGSAARSDSYLIKPSRQSKESDVAPEFPTEILQELNDHRDLLAKILGPILDRDGAILDRAERRMIQRLLADFEQLVAKLQRELRKKPMR